MRVALVLSGGGARGAYEAGVLSWLFENVYPRLGGHFEFEVVSGTSVGAIHAAYVMASSHMEAGARSAQLLETWRTMRAQEILQLSLGDLIGLPFRALGLRRLARRVRAGAQVLGGLVDIEALESIVGDRIPWPHLRRNLTEHGPRVLCISCTEIRSGRVTVFMDGDLAKPDPWEFDPSATAIHTRIEPRHVRASAAIPFLFPAVRLDSRYYVDGGLRMNTPLSPALRLGADRVLVVALKHELQPNEEAPAYREEVIMQPAFMLGKVLNALMLDQLEYELHRIGLVNAIIEHGTKVYGDDYLERMNEAIRAQRGAGYRHVRTVTIRPSQDVGVMAARCYREQGGAAAIGVLPALLAKLALRGVPDDEADLLSYLLFDTCFTSQLVEMGRADAAASGDEVLELLAP